MKIIKVVAKPDGAVSIDAEGYQGAGCLLATEDLERALGISGINATRKKKPEYFQGARKIARTQE